VAVAVTAPIVDYGDTKAAQKNRRRKATALADAAAAVGYVVVELTGDHLPAEVVRDRRARLVKAADLRSASDTTWQVALADLDARLLAAADAACSSCSSPVRWVLTEGGKKMPLDPLPHPDGHVMPVATEHGPRARVLAGHNERPDDVALFRAHWSSCPHADSHRKRTKRYAPRCAECGRAMTQALADLGYTTHPCCDADEKPWARKPRPP
jgi:hypothetical protein